jgi:hypothetical protein
MVEFRPNDALTIVQRARSFTRYLPIGYCANFTWNCVTSGLKRYGIADANAAWERATQKVTTGIPPAGAPVYWAGGRHGHIAVSVGGGRVRSTDWPTLGQVGEVDINTIGREWGITYRGWSRDFCGDPIPGLEKKVPPPPKPAATIPRPPRYDFSTAIKIDDEQLRPGRSNAVARAYNARIWSWLYYFDRAWCVANYAAWMKEPSSKFGPMSVKATQRVYAKLRASNAKAWPKSSLAATWPGPLMLRRLGLRAD